MPELARQPRDRLKYCFCYFTRLFTATGEYPRVTFPLRYLPTYCRCYLVASSSVSSSYSFRSRVKSIFNRPLDWCLA